MHLIFKKIMKQKIEKIRYNKFSPGTKIFLEGVISWALYRNSKNYGATAHIMDTKVDTGKIIEEKSLI